MIKGLRPQFIERADQRIGVHVKEEGSGPALVMLHGAGVASELTWGPLLEQQRRERPVLCIDLRGMGRTHAIDGVERPLSLPEVVEDVVACLDTFSIRTFDLVGYSFGGLIALLVNRQLQGRCERLVLLEPALFERQSIEVLREVRANYVKATTALLNPGEVEHGIRQFLDLISPNRSKHPRVERMTIQRLATRPQGLAYALMAVNEAAWQVTRMPLVEAAPETCVLVGGNTPAIAHTFHQTLATQFPHWHYQSIAGVDHAMPFQKPAQVSAQIFEFLTR